MSTNSDFEANTITKSREDVEKKLTEPPKYRVILHNDDFTPMDFVTLVLEKVFQYSYQKAWILMLKVHDQGSGVIGVYTYEIAEMKLVKAIGMAKKKGYPLMLSLEKDM
ncbi:MAG: ATP-dependent Clp protease adaptor ClpS [Acidobacteria bacterium]|nr:ATP-dependent Clp protease adaptor ClpS [Acidobacteriota bacterium]